MIEVVLPFLGFDDPAASTDMPELELENLVTNSDCDVLSREDAAAMIDFTEVQLTTAKTATSAAAGASANVCQIGQVQAEVIIATKTEDVKRVVIPEQETKCCVVS